MLGATLLAVVSYVSTNTSSLQIEITIVNICLVSAFLAF